MKKYLMELRELNIVDMNISLQRDGSDALEWKTMWEISEKNSVGGDVEVSWVDTDLEVKGLVVVKWVGVTNLENVRDNLVLFPSEAHVKSNVSSRDQVDVEVPAK
ncbi:hypothetical protein GCK72_023440 [Caenorhabditis remanei]|uniref:Uncharacterized protein n=1 Tax=Caenorhabditis remanei TaxID=31234 RepID=A0A6A5FWT4_CAERE|nr:hypothetical protein GCK72_023440 [Caenorhabditis remanei]KAF1746982.1 hypothetical protein GCK72_023440 [Caenorhabditis remanei]